MKKKYQMMILSLVTLFLIAASISGCSTAETSGDGSVGSAFQYEITGIDPGAGIMQATQEALKAYELDDWELMESSGTAMAAALTSAYAEQKPIIVTGWTPHWKFSKFDLKYLEDPKGVFGADEQIHTITRLNLADDHPSAYAFLDNFYWGPSDMEEIMVEAMDSDFETAAANWIAANADQVQAWTAGIDPVDGDSISLAYVAWDSEMASTNVVKLVLEESLGYKVDMVQLDPGAMWASISSGDSDAMVAAWLPTTHADYYERFTGQFEDLGPNLDGTKIGLVVPTYVEIDSIEDLKN